MSEKKVAEVNSSAGKEDVKSSNGRNSAKTLVNIGSVTGIKYSKERDTEGFLRFRIVGKTAIDGVICQVTGYVTQIRNNQQSAGSTTPSNPSSDGDTQ